jgi:signal transduction histidine kinase/CheY-like chemotaxis protein
MHRAMRTPLFWVASVALLLVVALVLFAGITSMSTRERTIENEFADLRQINLPLAEHAHQIFFGADLLASSIENRVLEADVQTPAAFRQHGATREMHQALNEAMILTADLESLSLVDADGRILNTSRGWPVPDGNVADRDYFIALRNQPGTPLAISAPLKNRLTGQETIVLARRVSAPDGTFLGVVAASIATSRFTRLFSAVLHGGGDSLALTRRDGALLVREPAAEGAARMPDELIRFTKAALARSEEGTLRSVSSGPGGMPELVALQAVRGYPLAIQATMLESTVLQEWWQLAWLIMLSTLGAVVLVLALVYALLRQWRLQLQVLETTKLRQLNQELQHTATERERAEEALRRMNEELEARVAQRTHQLLAAKDEAERANLAKSEFLSRMSHELRTPMNAVLGFAQLLELDRNHPLTQNQRDFVQHIRHAGNHLLELINDVLDLARVESGKLSINLEPVRLSDVIQECLALVRDSARARGIRVEPPVGDCAVAVRADRIRVKQVVLNLLANAVKYNRGQGSVTLTCASDGKSMRLSVKDTGAGLAPEQLARLFVPFDRLDADKVSVEGTGIGLALSKHLTHLMGGEIGVQSTPGTGSTFWIDLPLDRAPAQTTAVHDEPGAAATALPAAPAEPRRTTVLCIEDNAANLALIEQILARRGGNQLFSAADAPHGLELARRQRPDVILLDISLPGMDGWAAMARLQADECTRAIPVVAISANAMPRDVDRGRAAGFAAYLTKPLNVAQFDRVLDELLAPA